MLAALLTSPTPGRTGQFLHTSPVYNTFGRREGSAYTPGRLDPNVRAGGFLNTAFFASVLEGEASTYLPGRLDVIVRAGAFLDTASPVVGALPDTAAYGRGIVLPEDPPRGRFAEATTPYASIVPQAVAATITRSVLIPDTITRSGQFLQVSPLSRAGVEAAAWFRSLLIAEEVLRAKFLLGSDPVAGNGDASSFYRSGVPVQEFLELHRFVMGAEVGPQPGEGATYYRSILIPVEALELHRFLVGQPALDTTKREATALYRSVLIPDVAMPRSGQFLQTSAALPLMHEGAVTAASIIIAAPIPSTLPAGQFLQTAAPLWTPWREGNRRFGGLIGAAVVEALELHRFVVCQDTAPRPGEAASLYRSVLISDSFPTRSGQFLHTSPAFLTRLEGDAAIASIIIAAAVPSALPVGQFLQTAPRIRPTGLEGSRRLGQVGAAPGVPPAVEAGDGRFFVTPIPFRTTRSEGSRRFDVIVPAAAGDPGGGCFFVTPIPWRTPRREGSWLFVPRPVELVTIPVELRRFVAWLLPQIQFSYPFNASWVHGVMIPDFVPPPPPTAKRKVTPLYDRRLKLLRVRYLSWPPGGRLGT